MEKKNLTTVIDKLLYPDFEVNFKCVNISDKYMEYYLLGIFSYCALECAKHKILTPTICVKSSDDKIVFNNIINIRSVPTNFHKKVNLIPVYQFDFVFQENLNDILLLFKKEGTSNKLPIRDSFSILPLEKPFFNLILSDFYEFIDPDIIELKNELSKNPNNTACVSIRVHFYNSEKRVWEIVFID